MGRLFLVVVALLLTRNNIIANAVLTCPDSDSFGLVCATLENKCDTTIVDCTTDNVCCHVDTCGRRCVPGIEVPMCPAGSVVGPPCDGDEENECTDGATCCWSGCSRVLYTDDRCEIIFPPGNIGICLSECGTGRSCSSASEICCPNGCGTLCVTPLDPVCYTLDLPVTPSSVCEAIGTPFHACDDNGDCEGDEICCYYQCGRVCTLPGSDCPGGVELNCVANACDVQTCATHHEAECRTTCNGCIAHFYDKFGNEITDQCECPILLSTASCSCDGEVCKNYPDAECRINKCGGCNIEFFDKLRKRVDNCEGFDPACPKIEDDDVGICVEECAANAECDDGEICCSNGCGTVCIDKPRSGLNLRQLALALFLTRGSGSGSGGCPNYCIPCSRASCPNNIYAQCRGYCSNCLPRFFNIRDQDISSTCGCPRNRPDALYCNTNPCYGATCYNYPYAECRVSRCGGCHAEFFDSRGRRISCYRSPYIG